MSTDHEMPAAWQAQAARNRSPQVAAAIAARTSLQVTEEAHEGPGVLDELTRRRVARFAAQEARRLARTPPDEPLPPAAC